MAASQGSGSSNSNNSGSGGGKGESVTWERLTNLEAQQARHEEGIKSLHKEVSSLTTSLNNWTKEMQEQFNNISDVVNRTSASVNTVSPKVVVALGTLAVLVVSASVTITATVGGLVLTPINNNLREVEQEAESLRKENKKLKIDQAVNEVKLKELQEEDREIKKYLNSKGVEINK